MFKVSWSRVQNKIIIYFPVTCSSQIMYLFNIFADMFSGNIEPVIIEEAWVPLNICVSLCAFKNSCGLLVHNRSPRLCSKNIIIYEHIKSSKTQTYNISTVSLLENIWRHIINTVIIWRRKGSKWGEDLLFALDASDKESSSSSLSSGTFNKKMQLWLNISLRNNKTE